MRALLSVGAEEGGFQVELFLQLMCAFLNGTSPGDVMQHSCFTHLASVLSLS